MTGFTTPYPFTSFIILTMRETRITLATVTFILICIGVVMIYSASCIYALNELHDGAYFLKRHVLFLFLGLIMTLVVMAVDYRQIQPYAKTLMVCAVVMLIFVLIPGIGKQSYGARRWFRLGMFNF